LGSIENRLNGLIDSLRKSKPRVEIPLSVPGQVQHLIKEATSFDYLSQMYMGWAPYM
jgi:phosphatidylinositol kinase/protein kinase (PI-3  family)